ncbi:MAG TPA: C25 family cysteine peptidase, partial [Bacteroidales bacterium]|nr:C25 family cysteine peptidase [Bacteroidales bacterium]
LPVFSRLVEVPANASIRIKIIKYTSKEYKLADLGIAEKIYPSQPPQSKNSVAENLLVVNQKLYETNAFYGEPLARIDQAGNMRGVQLANLVVAPVQYNPVTNSISVYDSLQVEIIFSGMLKSKENISPSGNQSAYFDKTFSPVLNYDRNFSPPANQVPEKYVIVADPMFREALQPFVQWKTRRGFRVIQAYTSNPAVGNTTTSIKAYLKNLYTSATVSDPAPTFVLFVGDVEQVPTFRCLNHVSDLYYCEYTGDYLPEAFYGRFSAGTVEELLPQLNKTLQYEQCLMPDLSYLGNSVLAAGADATHQLRWGNGQINYLTSCYFNTQHNILAKAYLQPEPAGAGYAQKIKADINQGVAFASYSAHGDVAGWSDPSFTKADIQALQNKDRYPLIVANTCQTAAFDLQSFGEEMVRAENKGALGYIGTTDLSYWDEDFWWTVGNGTISALATYETSGPGAYDRMFHTHGEPRPEWCSTMGEMVFAGNMAVQASNSGLKQYYWEIYCLLGDPSTMIYFTEPTAISASFNHLMPLGSASFRVNTEPFAHVALSKNNILLGVAEADENGQAEMATGMLTDTGYAQVVITAQNRKPLTDSILIFQPAGPYLVADVVRISDEHGNNNQQPEPGEMLSLNITLRNIGLGMAKNVTITMVTDDNYLQTEQGTVSWPDMPAGSSVSREAAFNIRVNENVPDQHKALIKLITHIDTCDFTSEFSFTLYAPHLLTGPVTISDSAGNNNQQPDPGESLYISFPTTNIGHGSSGEITTRLFASSPMVYTEMKPLLKAALMPGETMHSVFRITPGADMLPGSSFTVFATASAGNYSSVSNTIITMGAMAENFETGDFKSYNWQLCGNQPWNITENEKQEGLFSAKSGLIGDSEKSEMKLDALVLCDDTLSFYRKVSSENGYDFLIFYMDGNELGRWSGNTGWIKASFPVPVGRHLFSWVYQKDEATAAGADAAWIDEIHFPVMSQVNQAPLSAEIVAAPAEICPGGQTQLFVLPSGGNSDYSYQWKSNLTLNDSLTFNPMASPRETTTYYVKTVSGDFEVHDSVTVRVAQVAAPPVVSVSGDQLVSSATNGNRWFNSQGMINGATGPVYNPTQSDIYYVKIINSTGCFSEPSNETAFVFTGLTSAENDFTVSPNPSTGSFRLVYTLKKSCYTRIQIFNLMGQVVATLGDGTKPAGVHQADFNMGTLPPGIYTCKLSLGGEVRSKKLVITN